jgi:hypothetical protein
MGVQFDETRWPVLVAVFEGEHDERTIEQFERAMDGYYARRTPFVTVYHIVDYKSADARFVKPAAQWYASRREAVQGLEAGMALVIPSDTFRFILSSILVVARLPKHYEVVTSVEAGVAWAQKRIAEFGRGPAVASAR